MNTKKTLGPVKLVDELVVMMLTYCLARSRDICV